MGSEYDQWSRARGLSLGELTPTQVTRLWGKGKRDGDCLIWQGYVNHGGYGVLVVGVKPSARTVLAHRAAYAVGVGPIPDRAHVLHSCDRRRCIEPRHLSLGNQLDNTRDMLTRGRSGGAPGERNGRALLTEGIARALREGHASLPRGERGVYVRQAAARLGVKPRTVWAVVHKENWVLEEGPDAVRKAMGV